MMVAQAVAIDPKTFALVKCCAASSPLPFPQNQTAHSLDLHNTLAKKREPADPIIATRGVVGTAWHRRCGGHQCVASVHALCSMTHQDPS